MGLGDGQSDFVHEPLLSAPSEAKPEETPAEKPAEKPEESPSEKPAPGGKLREWKSADGKFTVRAELLKVAGGTAHLKKEDGQEIKVPLERLSEEDQKSLRQR